MNNLFWFLVIIFGGIFSGVLKLFIDDTHTSNFASKLPPKNTYGENLENAWTEQTKKLDSYKK